MSQWKAGTVQAWLEVIMAMPMYIRACSENVKSGKVLLGLTDEDLELGLGVSSSMHRRKLRLAIEDYRDAEGGRGLSKAADMDHHWVAKAWLSDVGLPQYSQAFHNHLEFADGLQNSGVHGAVMVLDPSFNTDAMATALGIPSNKHMIRRHLCEEMKALISSARTGLQQDFERLGTPTLLRQSSLGRGPSSANRHPEDEGSLRRRAIKPPLGFSPKIHGGRDLGFHGSCGSLPREARDEATPRTESSPMHSYSGIEVTNV
ncbi:hypothetical protein JZ751_014957 [Albula glossodonta]|uniref:SAM domain-containing protein n=1 Tax=Albula glossodonta TaxID=121402 RepID=A0A8T2N4V6_9TELE|nr:hypothetical protein JZ751_014957 [Albula glossodonta]